MASHPPMPRAHEGTLDGEPLVAARPRIVPLGPQGLRFVSEIGRGRTGVVWRAWWRMPSGIERPVAVKVLHRALDPAGAEAGRLRDEARILALLQHSGTVPLLDMVEVDGRPAWVSELVEGPDLGQVLARGPLPPRAAVEVVLAVAEVLEAAHAGVPTPEGTPRVVIHRDVKPGNILLTGWGEVKLVDFGAAHAPLADRESRTGAQMLGSEGYIAPETRTSGAQAASDVFALGVVAWECLTGARLGTLASSREAHERQIRQAMERISVPSLRGPIAALLGFLPERRPTAGAVRHRWTELRQGTPGLGLRGAVDGGLLERAGGPDTLQAPARAPQPTAPPQPLPMADAPTLLASECTQVVTPPPPIVPAPVPNLAGVAPSLGRQRRRVAPVRAPRPSVPAAQAPVPPAKLDLGDIAAHSIMVLALLSILASALVCGLLAMVPGG